MEIFLSTPLVFFCSLVTAITWANFMVGLMPLNSAPQSFADLSGLRIHKFLLLDFILGCICIGLWLIVKAEQTAHPGVTALALLLLAIFTVVLLVDGILFCKRWKEW